MSRIGNKVIIVPAGVTVTVGEGNLVTVKGPKGTLSFQFSDRVTIHQENTHINITRASDINEDRKLHGTTRAVLANMVTGVSTGFTRSLEIIGVGYRASLEGKKLVINAGYSHLVEMEIPEGVTVAVPKNIEVILSGADKQVIGEFAANIRAIRKPEPYKGKGIRYKGENVRRKEGKTAKK
ncbi:50S ribosomal protein L6 [Acholeplasma vituli]|uniref:Large ribosomal subunit protein uL6 n=1 Tax=Paracholeplasma vituli TaxID=69473 RepID=A0ABT2PTH0_9MOLU|nr:50S ribosomal protein L6 [Paracholeplasma vituli]MCU0104245.1 50S ribosomal protein L6 [Paracholeplasma vituli]